MSNNPNEFYRTQQLKPELVLIQWFKDPGIGSAIPQRWLADLTAYLDAADAPLYFISDLRQASITDVAAIRETVGAITKHPRYGGGTSFSQKFSSTLYANLFARLSRIEKPSADTLEAALLILEEFNPGITKDIDWGTVVVPDDK